jgi:hypothetical protein
MEQLEKQHRLAIGLLGILDLSEIWLERQSDSSFSFVAWNTPLVDGNVHLGQLSEAKFRPKHR